MFGVKPRIPEEGAITDTPQYTMEEYSEYMRQKRETEYRNFIQQFKLQNPPKKPKILEIGPGPGWIGIWIAEEISEATITGLEPSPDMRRVAQTNAKSLGVSNRVTYVDGYVEDMSFFMDQSFDAVITHDSLHHWVDPVKGMQEIQRVLKKDSIVLISDCRRDLGIGGIIILYFLGRFFAGQFWKYWKSSVDASYTSIEIRDMLRKIPSCNWVIHESLMELNISNS